MKNPDLRSWLPLAFVVTVIIGFVFIGLQQHIRQEADYPQVQLAQDIATDLFRNQNPSVSLVASVDIEKSLAPFVILYDSNGKAVEGTGKLNGALAQIPSGILEHTRNKTEHRQTWQPTKAARIATVIRYYQNSQQAGFVLAGRNMREVEKQMSSLLFLIAITWASALIGSLGLIITISRIKKL